MEGLDLSVPGHDKKTYRSPSRHFSVLLIVLLVILLANTVILFLDRTDINTSQEGYLSSEKQKQLALKLENQGLSNASVNAWKEYIAVSHISAEETARIWYRIGKIYMQENQYEMALSAFYRSESFAEPEDISSEIARLTQECLESIGKFAALRYELTDRTDSSAMTDDSVNESKDPVVAEIGPQKITKSDLDRRIEYLIETQLSQFTGYLTEEQIKKQKEDLLKNYSADTQRRLFLNQYIGEELLYRDALKQGLLDSPEVKAQLKDLERSFLAAKLIEKRYDQDIKITQLDLENYYKANKDRYVQQERIKLGFILVKNNEDALEIRKRLEKGEGFDALARELSVDGSAIEIANESDWIEKGETTDILGSGLSDTHVNAIFSTETGKLVDEDIKSDKGVYIFKIMEREDSRQLQFDEVKDSVALELRSSKETEVHEDLLEKLMREYDVVIHNSAFSESSKEHQE